MAHWAIQALVWVMLLSISTPFIGCAPTPGASPSIRQSSGSRLVQQMTFPPLEFTPPGINRDVERMVLPNGIVLFLAADHSLPTMTISAVFKAGSIYEGPTTRGVAQLTAAQLASGGTRSLNATKLTDELEVLGISAESSVSPETLSLTLTAHAKDADRALDLFADMLRYPSFDTAALQSSKGRVVDYLRRVRDTPTQLASQEFARILYTDEHPLGHRLTPAEVRTIQRLDIQEYYDRLIRPDNLWLAVVGAFSTTDLADMIHSRFADWQPQDSRRPPPLAQVKPRFEPGLFLLPQPLTQTSVIVGHFGVDRTNPDRNAIEAMNLILGGNGLTGRLSERLRTKEGKTYWVASSFPTTSRDISLFQITLQTRTENVVSVVMAIQEEMRRLQTTPVSMEELTTAKGTLINTFVSRFPSRSKTVLTLLESEINGNPPEYFDTLLNQYETIRIQDVQRVAQRYLHPESATILIVGDTPPIEAAMKTYVPVHRLALPPAE